MSVQRTEPIPWQDYVDIADVVMTPYDTKVTEIDENANTLQVATSKTTPQDDAAARQATLLFEPGTDATMELPNGQTKPLGDLEVRATEYTVGADGEERMPGELPDSQRLHVRRRVLRRRGRRGRRDRRQVHQAGHDLRRQLPRLQGGNDRSLRLLRRGQGRVGAVRERPRDQDRLRGQRPRERRHRRRRHGRQRRPRRRRAPEARAAVRRRQVAVARRGRALHALGLQLALRLPRAVRRPRRGAAPAAVLPRVRGRRLDHRRLQPDARREAVRPRHAVRPLLQLGPRARLQGGLPARDPADRQHDPAEPAPRRARGDRRRPRVPADLRGQAQPQARLRVGRQGRLRPRGRGRPERRGPDRLRLPGRVPRAGRVRGQLRPVRRRARDPQRDRLDRGVAARDHRLAGVGAPRGRARRRRGRARRLDARRPPRLRPAGPHALPRRRLEGHHRGDPERDRDDDRRHRRRLRPEPPGVQLPARDRPRHRRRRRRLDLRRRDERRPRPEGDQGGPGRDRRRRRRRRDRPARRRGRRRRHALHLRHRQRADRQDRPARQPLHVRRRRRPRHARRRRAGDEREPQAAARDRAGRRRHALHHRDRPQPRPPGRAGRPHQHRRHRPRPADGRRGRRRGHAVRRRRHAPPRAAGHRPGRDHDAGR